MNGERELTRLADGRLAIRRQLGSGAFGTVYEAIDTRFGGRVAVKLLNRDNPAAVVLFKKEFRGFAEVVHPNLARLFELFVEDERVCFTMEYIQGSHFLEALSGEPSSTVPPTVEDGDLQPTHPAGRTPIVADLYALREHALQLASGIQAIHDAGKLHCDIKASNVMVATTGRVVLLDFGLATERYRAASRRGGMGTPGYVAPEQVRGLELTPAADWYSFGAMLHEALHGALPDSSAHKLSPTSEIDALASALLAPEPASRPTPRQVFEQLGSRARPTTVPSSPRLFGRGAHLATLRSARNGVAQGAPETVHIKGPSGIGKTVLVETFLDELDDDALVLRARCYEHESVPYKAFDPIVDALAEHLRKLRPLPPEIVPADSGLISRLFPVLRDAFRPTEVDPEADIVDERKRAFEAMRALFVNLGKVRPIVCALEDLHWGDIDSARLVAELLKPPGAPRMLLLLSSRSDCSSSFLDTLTAALPTLEARQVELTELSPDDACALASHLLKNASPAAAELIGREAAGHPLFIQQLAVRAETQSEEAPPMGLQDLILARIHQLDAASRRLLEAIAIAGQPLEEEVAIHAATLAPDVVREATIAIRQAKLATAKVSGGTTLLETAHDRVREAIVGGFTQEEGRRLHGSIAQSLEELTQPEPERLVHHYHSSGNAPKTIAFATVAAERAESTFAFERATRFRSLLVELCTTESDRYQRVAAYAAALTNAGRSSEAADAYERAANELDQSAHASGREAKVQEWRRRAGELSLRSGRLVLGEQRMRRVLTDLGVRVPSDRVTAALLAATRRARLFVRGHKPRERKVTTPVSRHRLDAIWSACSGISQMNHIVADAVALQFLLEALDSGDASAIVRGLGQESVFESVIGGKLFERRSDEMQEIVANLAHGSPDPYDRAWSAQVRGGAAWFRGDWQGCNRWCDAALQIYREECRGVSWEVALCEAYRLPALAYLGELGRLCEIVPQRMAAARAHGDLFAANTLCLGQQSLTYLVDDKPAEAIENANQAIAPFPTDTYLGPHYHHLFAVVQAELYRGRPLVAWRMLEEAWPDLVRARFLSAQMLRIEIRHLRARTAVAAARHRNADPSLINVALKDAAIIERDTLAPARPLAHLIRASVAALQNQPRTAREHLQASVPMLQNSRMGLLEAAANDRLRILTRTANEPPSGSSLDRLGVTMRKPQAIADMLVPGF